jgi:hypothetical protein
VQRRQPGGVSCRRWISFRPIACGVRWLWRWRVFSERTGFVHVAEARSNWAPDPANPLPTFSPPRRVPHGITLICRLFDEGTIGRVGIALEQASGVVDEAPLGFQW